MANASYLVYIYIHVIIIIDSRHHHITALNNHGRLTDAIYKN